MEYNIVYTKRKTICISVRDAVVTVRAPKGVPKSRIDCFVLEKADLITRTVDKQRSRVASEQQLNDEKIALLKREAMLYLKPKLDEYSKITGIKYGKIRITSAKRRFGSCNTKGTICFSYRLMLYPEQAREYVVLHELCHIVHMNHSADFYALIAKYMPDYAARRAMLKQYTLCN